MIHKIIISSSTRSAMAHFPRDISWHASSRAVCVVLCCIRVATVISPYGELEKRRCFFPGSVAAQLRFSDEGRVGAGSPP